MPSSGVRQERRGLADAAAYTDLGDGKRVPSAALNAAAALVDEGADYVGITRSPREYVWELEHA